MIAVIVVSALLIALAVFAASREARKARERRRWEQERRYSAAVCEGSGGSHLSTGGPRGEA